MGTIAVAWWNLENLFDTDDDLISQGFEFTKAVLRLTSCPTSGF